MSEKIELDCYEMFVDKNRKCHVGNRYYTQTSWSNERYCQPAGREEGRRRGREGSLQGTPWASVLRLGLSTFPPVT